MRSIYNLILIVALLILAPLILFRTIFKKDYRKDFLQRLGFRIPDRAKTLLWIHAVSVGEVNTARLLIEKLKGKIEKKDILLSVTTQTGRSVAMETLSSELTIIYFPFDFPFIVKRVFNIIKPQVFATIDTEIWPNLLWEAEKRGVPILILNARISDGSFRHYFRFRWFFKSVFGTINAVLAQSKLDAKRFIDLGVKQDSLMVAGNMKFDREVEVISDLQKGEIKASLKLGSSRKIIIVGSIHKGEELALESAIEASLEMDAFLIVAPRRIENCSWIEAILNRYSLSAVYKSRLEKEESLLNDKAILIIDTFGELAQLYKIADLAVIGGGFINHGGQNPLEAASAGVPTIFGKHISNFKEISELLIANRGAFQVYDPLLVKDRIISLLSDSELATNMGAAASSVLLSNQGATEKAISTIIANLDYAKE